MCPLFLIVLMVSNLNGDVGKYKNKNRETNKHHVSIMKYWWNSEYDVHFYLYTKKNTNSSQELKINDTNTLLDSNFDFGKRTKVITHGWLSSSTGKVVQSLKDGTFLPYVEMTDDNIITLDWSKYADRSYIKAYYYVPVVSSLLTEFLRFLVTNGVKTTDLHLIGHSLGAHVAGIAGKYYTEQRSKIFAITGLDPAYPFYMFSSEDQRLDKSDAIWVQVIHTCPGYLGYPTPLGHLDFYPIAEGRKTQPGCGWCGIDFLGACSHDRSVEYFRESIIAPEPPFTAVRCKDYDEIVNNGYCNNTDSILLNMSGLLTNYGQEGIYYFKTRSSEPYALGSPENWH